MIYLLEDDDSIRKLVVYGLESQGYEAKGFPLPSLFWKAMEKAQPELVLLDIMLPEEDGLSVLQKLRASSATKKLPVIILTAKNAEYDRVIGLDSGADDFISKPFGMLELVARVRAVLRRSETGTGATEYRIGGLYVCPEKHVVQADGADVALTYKEFELLCLLLENRGIVLTRNTIMDKVWGFEFERENRTLDVHIRTLRAKLGEAGNCIETVRGVGYKIGGGV
jgi:two-component system alkaline phosphatase synthesis response regulator PhoP